MQAVSDSRDNLLATGDLVRDAPAAQLIDASHALVKARRKVARVFKVRVVAVVRPVVQ